MENKRDEVEQKILRRVAVSLWLIIILIAIVAYLVKDVVVGGLREAIFVSTSIITQVYITNPDYASIIFLFAFIGKILLIYIVYVLDRKSVV